MKLSVLTGGYTRHFIPDDGDAVNYLCDIGYRTLDYTLDAPYSICNQENWLRDADRIKAIAKRRGVTFGQSHAPSSDSADTTGTLIKKIRRAIEISAYFEIPYVVCHFFKEPDTTAEEQYRHNAEFYSEIYPLLDKYGISICIENLGDVTQNFYIKSADQMLAAIKAMGHKNVHVCWDVGHGNVTNQDQYESIIKLGSELRTVHIHDNYYPLFRPGEHEAFDAHNFPLFGNINFDAVLNGLIDSGYKGTFSLESDTPNRRGHRDYVRDGLEVLKLKPIPFEIRRDSDLLLFKIGKYMLETYGIYEQ